MSKRAENYTSDILNNLMSEISPEEQAKTDKRMLLALKIANAMKAKGWKKGDLAREMNKQPSVITKWLSGTHNFESDTLFDLEDVLEVNLISVEERMQSTPVIYHFTVQSTIQVGKYEDLNCRILSKDIFIQNLEKQKAS